MIVGSLLLVIGALTLLVMGLVNGSDTYLVGSIAASLLAAIVLVVGGRRAQAEPATRGAAGAGEEDRAAGEGEEERAAGDGGEVRIAAERDGSGHGEREPMTVVIPAARARADDPAVRDEARERQSPVAVQQSLIPAQGGAPGRSRELLLDDERDVPGDSGDEDPPDEPVAQQVPASDAARVARMSDDVLVIDGRPRYHLAGCVHLLGRTGEPLPVHEAVELGFTPCGLCEPDSALLAAARQA